MEKIRTIVYSFITIWICVVSVEAFTGESDYLSVNSGSPVKPQPLGDTQWGGTGSDDSRREKRTKIKTTPIPVTGLEFRKDKPSEIDVDQFLEVFDRKTTIFLPFVQQFIRALKGLEIRRKFDGKEKKLKPWLEQDPNEDVAWTFQPYHLSKLVKIEFKIYHALKLLSFEKEFRSSPLLILESYLKDFEDSTLVTLLEVNATNSRKPEEEREGPYFYCGTHPTLVYMMMRRFAQDLPGIVQRIKNRKPLMVKIFELRQELGFRFPNVKDLNESMSSLSRIQIGADIQTTDLAIGKFEGIDTKIKVNALHSLEIGAYYVQTKAPDLALQWLHYGLDLFLKSPLHKRFSDVRNFFDVCMGFAAQMNNAILPFLLKTPPPEWSSETNVPSHFVKPVEYPFVPWHHTRQFDLLKGKAAKLRLELHRVVKQYDIYKNYTSKMAMMAVQARLCAGDNYQTTEEKSLLKCWFERELNAYWLINPLRVELVHAIPPVVQIYDFIGPYLGGILRAMAVDQLKRSVIQSCTDQDKKSGRGMAAAARTSYQAWLDDRAQICEVCHFYKEDLIKFSRRLELATGLTLLKSGSSESYQVAVYGSSHHFGPHADNPFLEENDSRESERITTAMGYLTDVKIGGRTAFPVLGFSATPVKGSILIWNNFKIDQHAQDQLMYHGGCPVVMGVKWIVNKWAWRLENMFNQKCVASPPHVFMAQLENKNYF